MHASNKYNAYDPIIVFACKKNRYFTVRLTHEIWLKTVFLDNKKTPLLCNTKTKLTES